MTGPSGEARDSCVRRTPNETNASLNLSLCINLNILLLFEFPCLLLGRFPKTPETQWQLAPL